MSQNIRRALAEARLAHQHYQNAGRLLAGGPASYYFDKFDEYITALFDRFAPFKTGDRVVLTVAPRCEGNWLSSAHFLIPGSAGEVESVDYRNGHFVAEVVFDRETWIDAAGVEWPVSMKHTYSIYEEELGLEAPATPDARLNCGGA